MFTRARIRRPLLMLVTLFMLMGLAPIGAAERAFACSCQDLFNAGYWYKQSDSALQSTINSSSRLSASTVSVDNQHVGNAAAARALLGGSASLYDQHLMAAELNVAKTSALLGTLYHGMPIRDLLNEAEAHVNQHSTDTNALYYRAVLYVGGDGYGSGTCELGTPASTPTPVSTTVPPVATNTTVPTCNSSTMHQGVQVTERLTLIDGGARIEVKLYNSGACSQLVGLATYKRLSGDNPGGAPPVYNQEFKDSMSATLAPKQSVTLSAALPPCAYQADAFYGPVIQKLSYPDSLYGTLKLDSTSTSGSYCANTPATATATNAPATATATSVPATATKTNVPATATKTNVPATATKTNVPATATATNVPATATKTNIPATSTSTSGPLCPSDTIAMIKQSLSYTITHDNGTVVTVSTLAGNVRQGDTVVAHFTIAGACAVMQLSLASYKAPQPVFDANSPISQTLFASDTGFFGPGAHALTVTVPGCDYQVDFVTGGVLAQIGPKGSGIFYGSHVIDSANGGANSCAEATPTSAPATATATNVPATVTSTNVPATATATNIPATATATNIPATATATNIPATATATNIPATATATNLPATATATNVPATATSAPASTSTNVPAPTNTTAPAPTNTTAPAPANTTAPAPANTTAPAPTNTTAPAPANTTAPAPANTATNTPVPPVSASANTPVPTTNAGLNVIRNLVAPSPTATAYARVLAARSRVVTKTRYVTKTRVVTKTRYVTKPRYVTTARYHDITRVRTVTRTQVAVKTIVRYHDVTRVRVVTRVSTVVNHKTVVKTVVRYRDIVRVHNRVVVTHKTVISSVAAYRYVHHPKTGRFAGPTQAWHGALPAAEARISVARLNIWGAPVWSRSFVANSDGSLAYDIVPAFGVTRFVDSAAPGQPGLSLMSGHDDIYGSIFRYLGTLHVGDTVVVTRGTHTYRYVVRSVNVVTPDDVRLLNATYTRPTLALISCTPYWVDTHRVVVIAELQ